MVKTFKRPLAFLSAAVMVMTMLLYFPIGIFSNTQWGLSASAATITPSQPDSGDGSSGNPYQIDSPEELYWFANTVNSGNTSACAKLTSDITVNSNLLSSLKYDTEGNITNGTNFTSWTPIGKGSYDYTGTFDGQKHTISGLYFNDESTDYVGLFGYVYGGSVSNVGVVDSYFKGQGPVGGVCGHNDGTITNCYNTGSVSGTNGVGGVCGFNAAYGNITYCYNTGSVSGTENVGGVCGLNGNGRITYCYNTGNVSGSLCVGGVCGGNADGYITNCYFLSGTATKDIGENTGSGSAESKDYSYFTSGDPCKALGYHSYNKVNGCCALCKGDYEPATYTTDKYDIDNNGSKDTVYEISNAGQLYWFAAQVNGGSTSINAVLTKDITVNTGNVANCNGNKAAGWIDWTPIGNYSNQYTGTFDGQNHTVSGLYFNNSSTNFVGLFGSVNGGSVSNVGVVDSYFNGIEFVGGVCGLNDGGTITNCYNTGNVTANGDNAIVGGVCGNNTGEITNCYNTGNVTATGENSKVGGVCGTNVNGTITNCYFDSDVYKGTAVGFKLSGTVGDNVLGKTTAQFKSGEVAYLLQGEQTTAVWGQQIGTDDYPVLGGAKVYQNVSYEQCESKPGDPTYSYGNTQKAPVYQEHNFVEGFCEWCGEPETCQHVAGYAKKINVYPSTCIAKGSYTLQIYCGKCDELMSAKRYLTPLAAHTYGDFYDCSDNSHAKECTVCGDKITGAHTFINGSCRDCGAETPDEYTVSIYFDGTLSSTKVYKSGTVASVSAPVIEGKVFSHWSDTPEGTRKLGTRELFRFYVSADRDIYAIYTKTAVKQEPVVYSSNAYSFVSGVKNYVRFEFTRDIPSDYEVVGHGIIYGNSTSVFGKGDEDSLMRFTDSGYSVLPTKVKKLEFTGKSGSGMDYINVSVGTSTDAVVYARGYAVVKDKSTGTTTVVYSDVKNGSFNSL